MLTSQKTARSPYWSSGSEAYRTERRLSVHVHVYQCTHWTSTVEFPTELKTENNGNWSWPESLAKRLGSKMRQMMVAMHWS